MIVKSPVVSILVIQFVSQMFFLSVIESRISVPTDSKFCVSTFKRLNQVNVLHLFVHFEDALVMKLFLHCCIPVNLFLRVLFNELLGSFWVAESHVKSPLIVFDKTLFFLKACVPVVL